MTMLTFIVTWLAIAVGVSAVIRERRDFGWWVIVLTVCLLDAAYYMGQ
jgi:maltodextrin utilization protein YvdJ